MLRLLTICAMFLVAGANPVQAQYQEAVLERVAIPGAGFDLVVATPKSENIIYGLDEAPDALVIRLHGGALILEFESAESMVQALDHLQKPIYSSWIMKRNLSPACRSRYTWFQARSSPIDSHLLVQVFSLESKSEELRDDSATPQLPTFKRTSLSTFRVNCGHSRFSAKDLMRIDYNDGARFS